jgi:O-antigen ligase
MFTAIYSNILSQKVFKDRRFINVIAIIRIVLSGWAILNCQARGAFVSLIVFVFLDKVVPKAIWRNRRITMLIVSSIIFVGIAFTYIYSQMYLKGVNFTLPFSQKPIFTGREIIWLNFYGQMLKNKTALFFGLGSSADLWEGNRLNLHNSYLTILTNFGIVGFFMFYGFWIYQIKSLIKKYVLSNLQIKLILGFIIVLILGYIEVSILWHNMFFLNYLFLGLAFEDRSSNNSFTNNY